MHDLNRLERLSMLSALRSASAELDSPLVVTLEGRALSLRMESISIRSLPGLTRHANLQIIDLGLDASAKPGHDMGRGLRDPEFAVSATIS